MTREEAIKIIDCYDINFYDLSGEKIPAEKLAEAFDMAIEALSAEQNYVHIETYRDLYEKYIELKNKSAKPSDLISRADAIEAVYKLLWNEPPYCDSEALCRERAKEIVNALPSADAEPIVIRAKTFMRKEDFDKWAEDIKRQGENIICIPCDAEVVSADADRPSVEIKECKPLCTEQKIAVEEFLNAPRITEECAIELLQMTGWLQEHDKEIGRPSGEWHRSEVGEYYKSRKLECSECGFVVCLNDLEPFFHYCPSCGAYMVHKESDE